jgi:hypothetical protein
MFAYIIVLNYIEVKISEKDHVLNRWSREQSEMKWKFYIVDWGQFLTTWFAPRGELCHLGGMFTPSFNPMGKHPGG